MRSQLMSMKHASPPSPPPITPTEGIGIDVIGSGSRDASPTLSTRLETIGEEEDEQRRKEQTEMSGQGGGDRPRE